MARRPNYRFERMERQRAKAAKKEARAKARAERSARAKARKAGEEPPTETEPSETE